MSEAILQVRNLKQHFKINRKRVTKAVDGISFDIFEGETFGLVGESGSGKSTTGRSIIRLYEPTSGQIEFMGNDITGKLSSDIEKLVRTNIQMIFQDPMASLNPRKKVLDIVASGIDNLNLYKDENEREEKVLDMLEKVGLSREHATRYPHQFSGGQRQRIGIARALIMNPKMVIADEAISALDVSIQAQVVQLLKDIQDQTGVTILFIAHDLAMVKYISNRIGVIHLGHMVEMGTTEQIFSNPVHPYTKSLLSAIPRPNPLVERHHKSLGYDYESSSLNYESSTMTDIGDHHFVLGRPEDFEKWALKKEL